MTIQPTKDNSFCWYPFHQLALKDWRNGEGIKNAAPCCNSIRPETPDPLGIKEQLNRQRLTAEEIFHSPQMQELRRSMLAGERHSACNTCWRIEDRSIEQNPDQIPDSYRLMSQSAGSLRYEVADIDTLENVRLQTIDFAFGENCNLRCRMCQPGLSNKLRLDYRFFVENNIDTDGIQGFDWKRRHKLIVQAEGNDNLKDEQIKSKDFEFIPDGETKVYNWDDGNQWQDILKNIHNLKHIKATGGETLLSKPFIEFLDTAIDRGVADRMLLEFHTNATKFSDSMIQKLQQFDVVFLNISIDSVGKNYEYIRHPMKFEKLDSSLRNLLAKCRYQKSTDGKRHFIKNFSFNCVLSVLNAHYLPDLLDYQIQLSYDYHDAAQNYSFFLDLLWPENKFINVQFLSPSIKRDLIQLYKNIETRKLDHITVRINNAIGFLQKHVDYEPTLQDRKNMLKEIQVFDLSRNQSYRDYLHPDIIDFLEK